MIRELGRAQTTESGTAAGTAENTEYFDIDAS